MLRHQQIDARGRVGVPAAGVLSDGSPKWLAMGCNLSRRDGLLSAGGASVVGSWALVPHRPL